MNKFLSSLSALVVAGAAAFSVQAEGVKGDAAAGAKINAMCIGCHGIVGYQASFPEIHKVPKISGQGAGYIVAALTAYKQGERKHPTMRGIAISLSEQDIANLGAYYEASGQVQGAPALAKAAEGNPKVQALLAKGACISCHGDGFNTPINAAYPKIAGQHADYLFVALKSYKSEGNATWGRSNAVMGGVAKQFSNPELKEMANYLSSLPTELKIVPQNKFK